ncbi:MAG: DUF1287 domain-containing protein [Armatimonadetes bacterium]|nr:DUF1287 domain-containing protein [Armatimonadota bacterium]
MITRSGWIARLVAWMLSMALAKAWVDRTTYISPTVLAGARVQLGAPAKHHNGYEAISYPNGDLPASWGSCADVSGRAHRICGPLPCQAPAQFPESHLSKTSDLRFLGR